jgi:hypothetical protein
MAYYIFLKSLRTLEEFRKNPHVKIPPKSPSTNFQSLAKFKKSNLIRRFFFLAFGPVGLRPSQPRRPLSSPAGRPKPLSPRAPLAYLQKYIFFFDSRLPSSVPSLSSFADAWTPLVSFFFSTAPPRPRLSLHRVTASRAARFAPWDTVEPLPPRPHHPP